MAYLPGFGPNDKDTLVGFGPNDEDTMPGFVRDPNVVMGEPVPMPVWVGVLLLIVFLGMVGVGVWMALYD